MKVYDIDKIKHKTLEEFIAGYYDGSKFTLCKGQHNNLIYILRSDEDGRMIVFKEEENEE